MRRRSAGGSALTTGSPSIRTSPLSGSISRLMHFKSVVLPDPEPPTNATNAAGRTVTRACWTAKLCPPSNDLLNCSISIRAPAMQARSSAYLYTRIVMPRGADGKDRRRSPRRDVWVARTPGATSRGACRIANVNGQPARRLDGPHTRWQRRRNEAAMLRDGSMSMGGSSPASAAERAAARRVLALYAPVLVFGGPYGNLEATRALLAEAENLGIAGERMICTGDVVAYCADPAASVELVREAGGRVVMGNCEESLAAGNGDCGCGFAPGSACEKLSAAWFAHAERALDADARAWMAGLPRRIDLDFEGRRLAVVHGGTCRINRFVFASTAPGVKAAELEAADADAVIAGHCGLPFTQIIRGKLWHNPGAIGMPANAGTPRPWFSLLVPQAHGLRIEHRALDYDHAAAARKLRAAGLPEEYALALLTGMWPSCDVLPYREIRERGVALRAGHALWRPAPTPA